MLSRLSAGAIPFPQPRRCIVNTSPVKLVGNISETSRGALYEDRKERVTVLVEGAEPLYSELRLRNDQGWHVGQRVMVTIIPAGSAETWDLSLAAPASTPDLNRARRLPA